MVAQTSLIALAGFFTATAAMPLEEYKANFENNAMQSRQNEWKLWSVDFFTSGCDEERASYFSGHDGQTFRCLGGHSEGYHNARMTDMAANGRKVILYSDVMCQHEVGQVLKDGTCVAAASNQVILGYGVVPS